jgi:hypothetical protein
VSLLPATATVIGIAVLAQVPTAAETTGLVLVIAGVALHREPRPPAAPDAPGTPRRLRTNALRMSKTICSLAARPRMLPPWGRRARSGDVTDADLLA